MRQRQPRGAHGIVVPLARRVLVFDTQLFQMGLIGRPSQCDRGSPRFTECSPESETPRSPSHEGHALTPGAESPSDSESLLATPTPFGAIGILDGRFSLRMSSPMLHTSIGKQPPFNISNLPWSADMNMMLSPPISEHPAPSQETALGPVMKLEFPATPVGFAYNAVNPPPEPFALFGDHIYMATSSPIPSGTPEPDFFHMWGVSSVGTMDWLIDPVLLNVSNQGMA
ncbi:hypothetical protein DACRYDRAFT_107277 [Dacryopinax primogenitus]|uniref:Uncharacterized protein n=1 Tax=Dacryopinax primogenitus (strain DJM 731) TaxID=1858805 RepID=M5FWM7_DACPD|nr:uncharacterized protein DACRYDRAFT_107277 [Dacryopinax primogenitus]EJU02351.1 hypothetical protein DACRYDRAFT_107277 [Dacryopinax primogenitus]